MYIEKLICSTKDWIVNFPFGDPNFLVCQGISNQLCICTSSLNYLINWYYILYAQQEYNAPFQKIRSSVLDNFLKEMNVVLQEGRDGMREQLPDEYITITITTNSETWDVETVLAEIIEQLPDE
jgi:hypothetical protein